MKSESSSTRATFFLILDRISELNRCGGVQFPTMTNILAVLLVPRSPSRSAWGWDKVGCNNETVFEETYPRATKYATNRFMSMYVEDCVPVA